MKVKVEVEGESEVEVEGGGEGEVEGEGTCPAQEWGLTIRGVWQGAHRLCKARALRREDTGGCPFDRPPLLSRRAPLRAHAHGTAHDTRDLLHPLLLP